jgi:hypothetical protein
LAKRFRRKIKEDMKHNQVIAGVLFVLFLMVITACGGGGGGTSGGNGSTSGGPYTGIRMEALLDGTTTTVDPTNIFVNEHVRFRLTGVDPTNVRVVIPTSNYTLTGSPGGTLDSNGLFVAASSPTGFTGSVRVVFDALQYTLPTKVVVPLAVVTGFGRTTAGAPGNGILINCLNAGGAIVATGRVASDGTIRISVPTTAVRFTADFSAIDHGSVLYYARQFAYAGKDYSTTIASCTAPLPALTNGVASNLATSVVFYVNSSGTPPPPPDGCP